MSTDATTPSWEDRRADAGEAVARLRESWAWLDELREPGPETSAGRLLTDAGRARQSAEAEADRHGANVWRPWHALPQGSGDATALAPSPSPVRLAIVDLQIYLARRVQRIADRVARRTRRLVARPVPQCLDWLDLPDPAGPWIATPTEIIGRAAGLDMAPGGTLAWATLELTRLDEVARQAAGVVTDRVYPWPDRCPACRRRSLQLDYTDGNRNAWSVRCTSARCLCTGTGCPCRHRVRYEGRRHAWSYGELDGPYGLWSAIAAASVPRPRLRHSETGHGGRP